MFIVLRAIPKMPVFKPSTRLGIMRSMVSLLTDLYLGRKDLLRCIITADTRRKGPYHKARVRIGLDLCCRQAPPCLLKSSWLPDSVRHYRQTASNKTKLTSKTSPGADWHGRGFEYYCLLRMTPPAIFLPALPAG